MHANAASATNGQQDNAILLIIGARIGRRGGGGISGIFNNANVGDVLFGNYEKD